MAIFLNDFQCESCGQISEKITDGNAEFVVCDHCGNVAKKIISTWRGSFQAEYPTWLNDTLQVVDRESTKPHVKQFLADPSRKNYKAWMKGEGIRHLETGEKRHKPDYEAEHKRRTEYVMKKHMERKRIEL